MQIESLPLDFFPAGIYTFDRKKRITSWNLALAQQTGFGSAEMIGKDASQIEYYDMEESTFDLFRCIRGGGKPFLSRTLYVKDAKGKLMSCFIQAKVIEERPNTHVLVTLSDISEEICCDIQESISRRNEAHQFHGIVGKSKSMEELFKLIKLASESTANVLISGESGTGKELVAKAIHNHSNRRDRPFVIVNCSALPETLLESELFGHVKGSFTGAYRDKVGKFEAANGGTIFLDEIGDISPLIQLKLLRVIQEKTFERVGDNRQIEVDIHIITATNKNLRNLVTGGLFREDLYYRLKVFPIQTVPFRDRKNDIPLLTAHFIDRYNEKTGKKIRGLTDDAARLLMNYCWPGNVRELENCIEYAFAMTGGDQIGMFDLPQDIRVDHIREELCRDTRAAIMKREPVLNQHSVSTGGNSRRVYISKEELLNLLAANHGNKSETARQLGMSRVGLWKKLKALDIKQG